MSDAARTKTLALVLSTLLVGSVLSLGGVGVAAASDASPAAGNATISGTLSSAAVDGDLSGTEPRVILRANGTAVDSTYADGGRYAFHNVSDGDYTLVARADGHRDATLSVSVSGGDLTGQDLTLEGAVVNTDTGQSTLSIQHAVENASTGDTVTVAPGVYRESIALDTFPAPSGLTLTSTGNASETVVVGQGYTPTINADGDATGLTVDGFTLRGSSDASVVVNTFGMTTNVTVTNNIIEATAGQTGISVNTTATIKHNEIIGADKDGFGIEIRNGGGTGSTVVDNEVTTFAEAFNATNAEHLAVEFNQFENNGDEFGENGFEIVARGTTIDGSTISITRNNFRSNGYGGGTRNFSGGGFSAPVDADGNYWNGNDGSDRVFGATDASTDAASATGTTVSGTVSSGAADFSVSNRGDASVSLVRNGSVRNSTVVAADGSYTFHNVPDASYTVVATADGHRDRSASVTVSGADETVNLTLPGAVHNERSGATYTSIDAAVDAGLQDGDEIAVAPGAYGAVSYDGGATGVSINATGAAVETVIDGGGSSAVTINADSLAIDGFALTTTGDIVVGAYGTGTSAVVDSIVRAGPATGLDIGVNAGQRMVVDDTEITNDDAAGDGVKLFDRDGTGSTVVDSVLTGFDRGVNAVNATDLRIGRNRFADNDVAGINVSADGGADLDVSSITVSRNNFRNGGDGLAVGGTGGLIGSVDAELNWWGSADGPGAGGADTVSGPVDVEPWLDAAAPGGTAVPTEINVSAADPSPGTSGATATYATNVTVTQVGDETPSFVSVDFGTSSVDLRNVTASDVTVAAPDDTPLTLAGAQTVDSGRTLLVNLSDPIADPSSGDTYDVTVADVGNGDAGNYTQTVGLHEPGSAVGGAAASAYATADDAYAVGAAPATFQVDGLTTNAPVAEGDTLTVDATVSNTGDEAATKTVALSRFDGTVVDNATLTLNGSETATVTLTWATTDGDADNGSITVNATDDSADASVSVLGERVVGSVVSNARDFTVGAGDVTLTLSQGGSTVETVTTDADGSYAFSTHPDGDYTVTATADHHRTAVRSGVTVDGGNTTVDLALDGTVTNVDAGTSYVSIGNAAGNASAGDTIRVRPGTYSENVDVGTAGLTIESTAGRGATTIAGGSGDDTVTVTARNVTLDGFTMTNAGAPGKSMVAFTADGGVLRNSDLNTGGNVDNGVFVAGDVRIAGVEISNATNFGIWLAGGSNGTVVENATVTDGSSTAIQAQQVGGGSVAVAGSVVRNTTVTGNAYGSYVDATAGDLTAEHNWWGAADGPGDAGPGSGQGVSGDVDFEPWLGAPDGDPVSYRTTATALDPSPSTADRAGTYGVNVTIDRVGPQTIRVLSVEFGTATVGLDAVEAANVTVHGPAGERAVNRTVAPDNATLLVELTEGGAIADASAGETYDLTLSSVTNGDAGNYTLTAGLHGAGSAVGGIAGQSVANGTDQYTVSAAADTTAPAISNFSVSNPADRNVSVRFDSNETLAGIAVAIDGPESATLTAADFAANGTGPYTYTATYAAGTDGDYTATLVHANDSAGNDGASGQSGTVAVSSLAGDGTVALNATPATLTVEGGERTTVDLVVGSAAAGVGGFDLSVALTDDRLAEITAVDLSTGGGAPASQSVSISADGSGADIAGAYLDDPASPGSVTVATLTVEGVTTGTTNLTVSSATVSDANGSAYTVNATTDAALTVTDTTGPTAAAGSDRTVPPGVSTTFDGTGSSDNVGVASFQWAFGDGATATGPTPSHTYSSPGTYTVTLTVTDVGGQTDTDTATVTVEDSTPPTADAGPNRTVAAGESVTLNASGSSDNAGIASYEWDFDGDGTTDARGPTATTSYASGGTYTVSLTVTDLAGQTATDTATVTVQADQAPTAEAGPNRTVTVGETVRFDASGSGDDGRITGYEWDFGDGAGATGRTTTHTYASGGTYTVTLTVTDDAGQTATDTATVTVQADQDPIAEAGPNRTVTVGETVRFDASGSGDDGRITGYEWDFGDGSLAFGPTAAHAYGSAGTYTVTLTVTDDTGQTATDTATVTVRRDSPPTAKLGPDRTVGVGAAVRFDASGSTDDNAIRSYEWDFDGDGTVDARGPTAVTRYGSPGTYTVSLTVTDFAGQTDTDTATVTVEPGQQSTLTLAATPERGSVANGSRVGVTVAPRRASHGLGAYNVTLSVDGSAAIRAVSTNGSARIGPANDTVRLTGGDAANGTPLATVTLRGTAPGEVTLRLRVAAAETDGGDPIDSVTTRAGTLQVRPAPGPLPGATGPPTNADADPQLEDVDGDGSTGIGDVLSYYEHRDSRSVRGNETAFDFDGDGAAGTVADALALYDELT